MWEVHVRFLIKSNFQQKHFHLPDLMHLIATVVVIVHIRLTDTLIRMIAVIVRTYEYKIKTGRFDYELTPKS